MTLNKRSLCIVFGLVAVAVAADAVHDAQRQRRYAIVSSHHGTAHEHKHNARPSVNDYFQQRGALVDDEFELSFEHDVKLNDNEQLANQIIMEAKNEEVNNGHTNPYDFNPSRHFFEVLDSIRESKLFKMLEKMPKGAVLHAHDVALCSPEFVISLTYWPNVWQCANSANQIQKFTFSLGRPNTIETDCTWRLVETVRNETGAQQYDKYVRSLFTLFNKDINPKTQFRDINDVWDRFGQMFLKLMPMVTYAPAWKAYYKQALKEMYDDGVQYLEFRGLLPTLYDLDGRTYDEEATMQIYGDALNEFKNENPGFIGSKFIYAPMKGVPNTTFDLCFEVIQRLHRKFPQFLAGFDLVGQEDRSPNLMEYVDQILQLPENIKLFFHAGETNWYGSIDENLVDAVLLGSHRIGHGYALLKHPKLLEMVKEKDIAVEINPVSNQVLKLVDEYRNHPAAMYFAHDIPLVVSSDDPGFWEAKPLTHDFYMAFLGIASCRSDLRTLKKLAMNSIKYSSLEGSEKDEAYIKWQRKWDNFIADLIESNRNSASKPT